MSGKNSSKKWKEEHVAEVSEDPLKKYNSLSLGKQKVCWNYYRFRVTEGKEGWNTTYKTGRKKWYSVFKKEPTETIKFSYFKQSLAPVSQSHITLIEELRQYFFLITLCFYHSLKEHDDAIEVTLRSKTRPG